MRPICLSCQRQMVPHKTGQAFHLLCDGRPYQIWFGDAWECRGCGAKVISGFGDRPVAEHYEEDFAERLARFRPVEIEQS